MPDCPPAALAAAERAIIDAATDFGHGDIVCGSSQGLARAALEAAAPLLADEIAQKILAHMNEHGPIDQGSWSAGAALRRAWLRHFGIAARVAAGAFYTREDHLRLAAEAIERGQFIACDIPEVPPEPEEKR